MSEENQTPSQDENHVIAERREKLQALRAASPNGNAFPNDYRPEHTAQELHVAHGSKSKEEFEAAAQEDYRLKRGSSLLGKAVETGSANGVNLQPQAEYSHPQRVLAFTGKRHNPGALQGTRPASRP